MFRLANFFVFIFLLSACSSPGIQTATSTELISNTLVQEISPIGTTQTQTNTPTQQATLTPTLTHTLSPTRSTVATHTPTVNISPTFTFPDFTVSEPQANCRYGPGTAYLYAAGLYEGDQAEIRGRNYSGTWLYLKPAKIDYFCWAAASVGQIRGDVFSVIVWQPNLPKTTFIGPPTLVQTVRDGDQVTVTWKDVQVKPPEDARGYLIEAVVCQNGSLIEFAVHTDDNGYVFNDSLNCEGGSGGKLYAVEKHGYTDPVPIPWPE